MNRLLIFIFLIIACEKYDVIKDNPLDPQNPNYEQPAVLITTGPTDSSVVDTTVVTFGWTGNELVSEYRYKFTGMEWSNWDTTTIAYFNYLDEEEYQFSVQSKYENEDTSEVSSVNFTVNAIKGPALILYPSRQITNVGSTISFDIQAEEVTNLAAAEFQIIFDSNSLQVLSVGKGDMFNGLGNVLFLSKQAKGFKDTITINTAIWGDSKPSASGTGTLAEIQIKLLKNGLHEITFQNDCKLRDPENNNIKLSMIRNGYIEGE